VTSGGALSCRAFQVTVMSLRTCYPTHSNQLPPAVWLACVQHSAMDRGVGSDPNKRFSGGFSGILPKTQEGST